MQSPRVCRFPFQLLLSKPICGAEERILTISWRGTSVIDMSSIRFWAEKQILNTAHSLLSAYQYLALSLLFECITFHNCFGNYRCDIKWLIACVTNSFAIFILHLHEDNLPQWANGSQKVRSANQSNNNHFKNTPVVHFSAFVNLATETLALLPL